MDLETIYDKIYRYVYFRVNDRTTAEDITQEAFLRYLGNYGDNGHIEIRYMYTIARNLCTDEYRRIKPESLTDEMEDIPGDSGISEEKMAVREALEKLPYEDRELLLLRYVNEEPAGTICKALGISRFALYRRLKNAEDRLRRELEA
ncbi:MAG: sigma-70 family RNA polymerase sigma factor [Lachnospiraceae bacterium]|nr:sigma-70 family RNA polymerase sigma factor [Lachnospiraceae bacterium]MBP1585581.1 sigma-70 family RNA polymerase sigma factor [Lachnospiraceae bacterium]